MVFFGGGVLFCLEFFLFFAFLFREMGCCCCCGVVFDRNWPISLKVLEIWENREEGTDKKMLKAIA